MAYRTGGYILIDPNTGASGYYLGNGTNGLLGEQETLLRPVFTGQGLAQGGILGPGFLRWLIRTPEVSQPAPLVPEVAQFKGTAVTPWDLREPDGLPCADAARFLMEATGEIAPADEGCEALRALLRGLSQGLADGGYFGLEGDMAEWSGIPASLTGLARFVKDADYRTQFLAEVRQAVAQLWVERAELAAGLVEAVGTTLKEKSPFSEEDSRFVPWTLGYSVGWVAGLVMEASANLGPPLTVGGAVIALGGLLAVGVTSGLVKFFRLVRDLPGARGGGLTVHVVALARRFAAEERGSLYLGALLARDIEDLRLHTRFVAEAARLGGDTALLAEIRAEVWDVYWRGLNEARKRAEAPEASWLDKQNLERFVVGLRAATGKATVPETMADEIARRQLQVLGMSEREYHLLRTMPAEALADEHVAGIRSIRLLIPIPRAPGTYMIKAMKAEIAYAIVTGGTLPNGRAATSAYFGHVTFSPFVPGAHTSLEFRERLVLDSVAPHGYGDEDDLIALFSSPVEKLNDLETQLDIPFHPRFGGSNYQFDFPSSGNGLIAFFGPATIPEWLVAIIGGLEMPAGTRAIFVDSRGLVHDVYELQGFDHRKGWVRLGP